MHMIKRNILTFIFLVTMGSFAMGQAYEHCDVKELKDTCKNYLDKPYRYDASNIILIQFKKKQQVKEVELPMFLGENYKIIFNTYALPPGVQIDVYNKSEDHDNRKSMFTCSSSDTRKVYIYATEHWHTKLYIDYTIPPSKDKTATDDSPDVAGCGVMVVGYK
jgi:hypothetical protein